MTSLTPLKSDYTRALEKCVSDCQLVINNQKNNFALGKCLKLCRECIDICEQCIAAFESASLDRGSKMHQCVESCNRCIAECLTHKNEECQKCAASCEICIEELSHVLA